MTPNDSYGHFGAPYGPIFGPGLCHRTRPNCANPPVLSDHPTGLRASLLGLRATVASDREAVLDDLARLADREAHRETRGTCASRHIITTFPNASYLMDKQDLEFWGSIEGDTDDEFMQLQRRVFGDSMQPVLDAGLAKPIEATARVCEGVRLIPTPGHTPGHCSVLIESNGESAMITGDFLHHPIQFNDPDLVSPFDVDNDTAIATRRRVFAEYADSPTLIIGTHFAGPTAGKLVRDGGTYRLDV